VPLYSFETGSVHYQRTWGRPSQGWREKALGIFRPSSGLFWRLAYTSRRVLSPSAEHALFRSSV